MLPEAQLEAGQPSAAGVSGDDPLPSPGVVPAPEQPARNTRAFRTQFALDSLALAATDISGGTKGVGPAIALHVFVAGPLSLRAGVGARWGSVSGAQASALTVVPSAGAVVHALRPTTAQRFGASIRFDYLLAYESLTRSTPDALGQSHRARWVSGLDAFVDGSWLAIRDLEVVAGLGLEYMLGATRIDLQAPAQTGTVATLAPLHAAAELGFRWGL
jgi:hypothetical protein